MNILKKMTGGGIVQGNGNCKVCEEWTTNKCSKCEKVFFCSDHETTEMENHVKACKPYQICSDGEQHHVVATRSIEEGTVILEELPLIIGPNSQITIPVCLGCFNILDSRTSYFCKKCGWCLCSKKCQFNPVHTPECYYLSRKRDEISFNSWPDAYLINRCILILRCLYQKLRFPLVWKKINRLESHYSKRQTLADYQNNKKVVLETLYSCFGLKNEFSVDEIMEAWSISLTNEEAVPITTPHPVAIYEVSPLLEHNCWANCYKSIDSQGVLRIIAGVAIPEGQRLSICYTNPLWTTFNRQTYLEKNKFLKCKCERCVDVTENLTYISAVNCVVENCLGVLLPKTFVTSSPLWECNKCYMSVSQFHVSELLHRLGEEYITIKTQNNCEDMKMYLGNNKKIVPEYHSYMIEAKLVSLSMLGGITPVNMHKISLENVVLKASLCRELIELLKKIAPAEKRIIGYVYYNLQLSLEEMYRRRILSGDTDVYDSIFCVKTFKQILEDVVKYLKYESTIEMEGRICAEAKRKLTGLDLVLLELEPDLRSECDRMFNAFLKY